MLATIRAEFLALDMGRKSLRSFGLVVGAVLLGIAGVVCWRQGWTVPRAALWLAAPGGLLVLLGLVAPLLLRPAYRLWMGLALVLGFVMTRVLLTAVFLLTILPLGLVFRLIGKDPLDRKIDRTVPSYWRPKEYHDPSPKRLERYF